MSIFFLKSGRFVSLGLVSLILLFGVTESNSDTDMNEVWQRLHDLGQSWFDEVAPDVVREWIEFPERGEWMQFWRSVEQIMHVDSYEDLAWIRPEAEAALRYLEATPIGEPYAAWLLQRMDYLDMAESALRAVYGTSQRDRAPPRPAGRITPPPRPPAPRPPPETERRVRDMARDRKNWEQKVGRHPAPKRAEALVPRLKPIFEEEGIPPEWVWLAEVESSFNPEARSPVGATGLFQFMPATAERFGLRVAPVDDRLNPDRSARAAAQYLRFLHGRFDSWPLALAAYNAGEGRVGRVLKTHNASTFEEIADHLPAETQMYVPKVLATVALREGIDPMSLPPPRRRAGALPSAVVLSRNEVRP